MHYVDLHTYHLPLKPRLARLFNTSNMAQVLQSHVVLRESDESFIYDIHQSTAWNDAYKVGGFFGGDKRGISLALCTDGVNPFAHSKVTYSMWPIMLTLLNLPRSMRNLLPTFCWLASFQVMDPRNHNL